MTDSKICKACGKPNEASATVCAYCNTPFLAMISSQTTSHVPLPDPNKQFTPERVVQLTGLYADLLVFQIANFEQPLLVKVSGEAVTIGRYSPGEKPPTVDLTPFNGSLMGVSRKHAMIIKDETGYKVQDLSSTNGTWLNDSKLIAQQPQPLKSGDVLRLGQINTSIYFRLNQANNPAEVKLTLQSETEIALELKLTPQSFETLLLPYLKALEAFQRTCDEIMAQPVSEMIIASIAKDTDKAQFIIKVTGLYQAFRLLRINVARWREAHLETIVKLNQQAPIRYPDWSVTSNDGAADDLDNNSKIRLSAIELTREILTDLAPHRTKEDNETNIPKLLPYLRPLLLSPLRLVQDSA